MKTFLSLLLFSSLAFAAGNNPVPNARIKENSIVSGTLTTTGTSTFSAGSFLTMSATSTLTAVPGSRVSLTGTNIISGTTTLSGTTLITGTAVLATGSKLNLGSGTLTFGSVTISDPSAGRSALALGSSDDVTFNSLIIGALDLAGGNIKNIAGLYDTAGPPNLIAINVNSRLAKNTSGTTVFDWENRQLTSGWLIGGNTTHDKTITTIGTTGAQTINKTTGTVNFAAAASSLIVTNSLSATSSIIHATVATNDATMKSVQAVALSGSFTLYPNANPTAETRVNFTVTN